MWEFLKNIFTDPNQEYTVKILNGDEPENTRKFHLKRSDAWLLLTIFLLVSLLFSALIFFVTPLGNIFEKKFDHAFRSEVLEITNRVEALQDSIAARDIQLHDLKNFVRTVPDTTFEIEGETVITREPAVNAVGLSMREIQAYELFNRFEILNNVRNDEDLFLAMMPAEGNITQGFSERTGHYGIDIALTSGTPFLAVEDGVVVYAGWTMNYGYILILQHTNGFVSVYKHAENLLKKQGEFVVKGDILGSAGDRGIISSGSHLHFEIWDQGIPENPLFYLGNDQTSGY